MAESVHKNYHTQDVLITLENFSRKIYDQIEILMKKQFIFSQKKTIDLRPIRCFLQNKFKNIVDFLQQKKLKQIPPPDFFLS